MRELDEYRGVYLSSGYEFPGRYSRWDIVSVRPPLELSELSAGGDVPASERTRGGDQQDAGAGAGRASALG